MAPDEGTSSIGEVAERTGLSIHALRLYEREGLLARPVERAANGHRRYSPWDVEWLTICTNLRASGMSLGAIRRYAELVRAGPGNEPDRLALLRDHEAVVRAQIEALTASLELVSHKVGIYEDRLARGTAEGLWSPPAEKDRPEAARDDPCST